MRERERLCVCAKVAFEALVSCGPTWVCSYQSVLTNKAPLDSSFYSFYFVFTQRERRFVWARPGKRLQRAVWEREKAEPTWRRAAGPWARSDARGRRLPGGGREQAFWSSKDGLLGLFVCFFKKSSTDLSLPRPLVPARSKAAAGAPQAALVFLANLSSSHFWFETHKVLG